MSIKKQNEIITFNKLYGYIKYFHPSDEAAELDWDAFAIYGVQEILNAPENEVLEATLNRLFKPIAPSLQLYKEGEEIKFNLATITPNLDEAPDTIQWQHIGNGNFNNQSTYKSLRTGRLRKFYPSFVYREKIAISFEDEFEVGEYRFKYQVKNQSNNSFYRTYIETCHSNNNGKKSCNTTGYYVNEDWYFGSDEFTINTKSFNISINVIPRSSGKTYIDNIRLFKKNGRKWKELKAIK